MEDHQNNAALPEARESQVPQEQATESNTNPVRSQHTTRSGTGAEAPHSTPSCQQESHKQTVPLLERDLASEITTAGILDHLLDRHPEAFEVGEDAPPATGECVDDSNVERIADAQRLPRSLKRAAPARGKGKSGQKQPGRRPRKPGPPNPFAGLLASEVDPLLEADVDGKLQASAVADELIDRYPDRFAGIERKSLCKAMQRYFSEWRRQRGKVPAHRRRASRVEEPPRRGKVPRFTLRQDHLPGREARIDFTSCNSLGVTIKGKHYAHKLFLFGLSHSGWIYAEIAAAETGTALIQGLQSAMWDLGGVPEVVRSDNSSTLIHDGKATRPYRDVLAHYGLKVSLTNRGSPWENGGAERGNGLLKTGIDQALRIRGSRDFKSERAYTSFVRKLVNRHNRKLQVQDKLAAERDHLRPLPTKRVPDHVVLMRRVQSTSCIEVGTCRYSVPSRALGEMVTLHLYPDLLKVYRYNGKQLTKWKRLHGRNQVVADPRHLIVNVLRKWRGFERWDPALKQCMFPSPVFRECYEVMREWDEGGADSGFAESDYGYLRILDLALRAKRERTVAGILKNLLKKGAPFGYADVKRELARLLGWPEEAEDDGPKTQVWFMDPIL